MCTTKSKAKIKHEGDSVPDSSTNAVDLASEVAKNDEATPDPPKPPFIVHRSRDGLKLIESFSMDYAQVCAKEIVLAATEGKDDRIESVCVSEDGEYVAWCERNSIKCLRFSDQEVVLDMPNDTRSNCLMISPRSTKLITFNTMAGGDNLHFWDLATQTRLMSMPFKRASQWKPVFSMNEDVCIQQINGELVIYTSGNFDKPKHRLSHFKINAFSLSSASFEPSQTYQHIYNKRVKHKTHYIAIYTAGAKGQPSIVKIYKYPNMTDCITNKSFFKADSVKFSWSPSGQSMLLICQADFDKSGKSYFGEQSLNYLNVKGESYFVKLSKEGAISHIEWVPSCDKEMFICVYGLMPAKVSLFSNKCEVLFDFGDQGGRFNETKFSPFGNLLAVFGIGNLAGQICIWDFEKKKLIASMKVPETTGIEWCADGKHLLTCTTSPRLRVGNGYRLWHYTGSLIHEDISQDSNQNLEIYDVVWQARPGLTKKPKVDSKGPLQPNLISQSKLSKFQNSAGKYVPPSERNAASIKKPNYLNSAIGLTAGNRPIVGLESLSINSSKNKPNRTKNNKGNSNPTDKTQKTSGAN